MDLQDNILGGGLPTHPEGHAFREQQLGGVQSPGVDDLEH